MVWMSLSAFEEQHGLAASFPYVDTQYVPDQDVLDLPVNTRTVSNVKVREQVVTIGFHF